MRYLKRILRYILYILCLVIVLPLLVGGSYLIFRHYIPARMYLRFGEEEATMRVEVPYEIVKAQNCEQYREWIHNNYVAPGFVASDRCPWRTPPKGPVAEFVLKGVDVPFWVPREYLATDKQAPDGIKDGIYVWMSYPDMAPTTDEDEKNHLNISLYIDVNRSDWLCKAKPRYCSNRQQQWWENMHDPLMETDGSFAKHELVRHLVSESLDEYSVDGRRAGTYIRGPFEEPEFFYKCSERASNPGCHSAFNYNDKIFIDYFFNRKLLPFHDHIRIKIKERISQWLKQMEQANE
jgi:hypothetical protein